MAKVSHSSSIECYPITITSLLDALVKAQVNGVPDNAHVQAMVGSVTFHWSDKEPERPKTWRQRFTDALNGGDDGGYWV